MSHPAPTPAAPAPTPDPKQDPQPDPSPAPDPQPDRGFPESTPIAEMTADQQAAYWRFHDRRKSDTLKAYDGITPDQAKQYAQRVQELERSQMDANDRAIAEARDQAAAEAAATAVQQWAPELASEIVGQFVPDEDQRKHVLGIINPMAFVKDGKFDKDALIGHLTGISVAFSGGGAGAGSGNQPRQWGQGGSQPPATSGSDEGLAEARRRGYITD